MKYIKELEYLSKDYHYQFAKEFLNDYLLKANIPTHNFLVKFYPENMVSFIQHLLENLYKLHLSNPGTPRLHVVNSPHDIADMRKKIEVNNHFHQIHLKILLGETPDIEELNKLYGDYSEKVRRIIKIFLDKSLKRKCGLNSPTHHNRVGALVGELGLNDTNKFNYSAAGCLHDSAEDLLNIVKDENGKFGINRYDDFLEYFIPSDLHKSIKLLTNYYDLILSHIEYTLKKYDKRPTKDSILKELEEIGQNPNKTIQKSITKMYNLVTNLEMQDNISEAAHWQCYKSLYISDMADYALENKDPRTFQIKAIDLSDNAHGSKALDIEKRIKNILKLGIWAKKGYELKTTWGSLNNYVMELLDNAQYYAENIVINDLLEVNSSLDFLTSAVIKINKLESIFYIDREQDS